MRIGQNPAKMNLEAYQPEALGIATLTYMPNLEGYFAELPAVLRLMLSSLRKHTPQAYDLLVFDNGSCPEAQANFDPNGRGRLDRFPGPLSA